MARFVTTTPLGKEGFNISYSDEKEVAKKIGKVLPKDWSVSFTWAQILFSDVSYEIDTEKKVVEVVYNQNLIRWSEDIVKDISAKLSNLGIA